MSRAFVAALYALVLTVPGCNSSEVTAAAPFVVENIDRIELQAWRETLGPAYPLTIARSDSIAAVLDFFAPNSADWRNASAFPGIAILASFLEGDQVRAEYGFVEISHSQGGFLVNRMNGRVRVRAASPDDITRFLAFFGVGVEIVPD